MRSRFDFDINGATYDNGNAVVYTDDMSIKRALEFWLTSKQGDFLKNPTEGGIIDKYIFKGMRISTLEILGFTLLNAFNRSWSNILRLKGIEINPNFAESVLEITVTAEIIETENEITTTVYAENYVDTTKKEYTDIEYTGENLYEFCQLQKPSMGTEKLVFSAEEVYWVWGKYRLINLTDSDPYFEDILLLING